MDIEKYIMEYSNIIPKDLTDEIMGANIDYQKSSYSNKTGTVDNSNERVNMDEFWIRNTHELYEPLKKDITRKLHSNVISFSIVIACFGPGTFQK